tara:strand:+ start:684 stop:1148 length:465 start_codon:yes stop_codon:yes gene_type:complete
VNKLIDRLKRDNQFYFSEIHGIQHYCNVSLAGLQLATHYDLNPKLVRYFAYLHDSCRENEGTDPDHGPRAADYIESIKHLIDLCTAERWMLQSACAMHTRAQPWDGHKYTLFEKCAFDADRSDIGRVCFAVDPDYLFTEKGKELFVDEEEYVFA